MAKKITPCLHQQAVDETINTSEIKKKSVKGAISFFARTLILNGLGLAANLILGGLLMVADFGVYGVVTQIIGVLTFFSDIGLASALIQSKKEPTEHDYQTIFWTQMALAGLIVFVCWILVQTGWLAAQLETAGAGILYALAFGFVLATFKTVPSIKLTRSLDFNKLIWPQIIEQVVFYTLLIYLVMRGVGVSSYTWAIWARNIVGTAVMLILVPFWPRFVFAKKSFWHNLRYGCKFQANDLLSRVKDNLFYLFIAKRMSIDDFGLISFAKTWSMYPYNLTVSNVMSITFPTFSRLQANVAYLRKGIEKSIFFITVFIFPILTGMCVFFWPLTQVITKYHKWEPATLSFILFTLAIAPAAISTPLTNVLNAIGKINDTLKLMVFWTILTWVLTLPLLSWIGFNAVAVAAFVISLTSFLPVVLVKKYVPFSLWDQIWRQLTASLCMAAFAWVLLDTWTQSLLHTVIGMMLSSLVYFVILLTIGYHKIILELRSLR